MIATALLNLEDWSAPRRVESPSPDLDAEPTPVQCFAAPPVRVRRPGHAVTEDRGLARVRAALRRGGAQSIATSKQ